MDVVIGLVAVFVGWFLGFGQQAWRDRREAQLATRLIIHEIGLNKAELESRANRYWGPYRPTTHRAWETYGITALRVVDFNRMHKVHMAQLAIDYADQLSKLIVAARDDLRKVPDERRSDAEGAIAEAQDAAREAVAEVVRLVDEVTLLLIGPAHETFPHFVKRSARKVMFPLRES